jgi:hypothetical protein
VVRQTFRTSAKAIFDLLKFTEAAAHRHFRLPRVILLIARIPDHSMYTLDP